MWCASHRPSLGVRLFLSLFAVVSRRFSLQDKFRVTVSELPGWGRGLGLHTGDRTCQGVTTLDASGRVPDIPLSETCPGQDRARA